MKGFYSETTDRDGGSLSNAQHSHINLMKGN
jgi:hypothetical protein